MMLWAFRTRGASVKDHYSDDHDDDDSGPCMRLTETSHKETCHEKYQREREREREREFPLALRICKSIQSMKETTG